jgi:acyl carrier protein
MNPPAAFPDGFAEVVREHLPGLAAGETLTPDHVLADHGLDSLRRVSLLIALEDTFDVTFPDELLAGNTFATVGSLCGALEQVRAGAG